MGIDDRIAQLVAEGERQREDLAKMQVLMAQVIDSVARLERVAGVLLLNDEELDRRLTELEHKRQRKPQ